MVPEIYFSIVLCVVFYFSWRVEKNRLFPQVEKIPVPLGMYKVAISSAFAASAFMYILIGILELWNCPGACIVEMENVFIYTIPASFTFGSLILTYAMLSKKKSPG